MSPVQRPTLLVRHRITKVALAYFNPSIAHHSFWSSKHVFAWVADGCKTISRRFGLQRMRAQVGTMPCCAGRCAVRVDRPRCVQPCRRSADERVVSVIGRMKRPQTRAPRPDSTRAARPASPTARRRSRRPRPPHVYRCGPLCAVPVSSRGRQWRHGRCRLPRPSTRPDRCRPS